MVLARTSVTAVTAFITATAACFAFATVGCSAPAFEDAAELESGLTTVYQGTIAYGATRKLKLSATNVPGAFVFDGAKDDLVTVGVTRYLFSVVVLSPANREIARIAASPKGGTAYVRLPASGTYTIRATGYAGEYDVALGLGARPDSRDPFDAVCEGAKLSPSDVAALTRGDSHEYGRYRLFRRQRVCVIEATGAIGECEPNGVRTTTGGDVRLYSTFNPRAQPNCTSSGGPTSRDVLFALDGDATACRGLPATNGATCHLGYGAFCQQPDGQTPASCGRYTYADPAPEAFAVNPLWAECGARYLWPSHGGEAALQGTITKDCMKLSATDKIVTWRGSVKKWTITDVVVVAGSAMKASYDTWPTP